MTLPKIQQPIYELVLPSNSKRKISYRPYLSKEDKIILQAAETNDALEMSRAIRQIVNNCVLDKGFDCEDLPVFDVDFIYMNLRAKSVGEKVPLKFTCNADLPTGGKCENKFEIVIDVNEIKPSPSPDIDKILYLTPDTGVKMKWPTYKVISNIDPEIPELEQTYKTIFGSVEHIFDKTDVYPIQDSTYDEFKEFLENLTLEQYSKITNFLDKMPGYALHKEHVCEVCGHKHEFDYADPTDFF